MFFDWLKKILLQNNDEQYIDCIYVWLFYYLGNFNNNNIIFKKLEFSKSIQSPKIVKENIESSRTFHLMNWKFQA
jgi:hypothetical protein